MSELNQSQPIANSEYQYDIIFCTLPPLGVDRIYSAPAILKAVVQSDGYRARCFDFVLDLFEFCNRDFEKFSRINQHFVFANDDLSADEYQIKEKLLDHIVQTCVDSKARYFGFSVFSLHTHSVTVQLILKFKEAGLSDRVVLGGRGISTEPWTSVKKYINIGDDEFNVELGDILVSRGLVNHVIKGDGEEAVLGFLRDSKIENVQHRTNKLENWYPDYSDYDFSRYPWARTPRLDVTGSTGCVRSCDFCDVQKQFGKFKYKAGRELAEELIYNQKTYGISEFIFTDSLVNGGLRPFNEFITRLAEHNVTTDQPLTWAGMFICRDISERLQNDNYYRLLKQSGASGVTIGAESGSNHVLQAMDKKTSVEALFFDLENFRKWDITAALLTFVGHWSERHEDFVKHCEMLIKLIPYIRSGTIVGVELGTTYKMLRGTPAFNDINIIKDLTSYDNWTARSNRGNTYKTRSQRRLIISKLAYALNMGVDFEESLWLQTQIESIKNNKKEINAWFKKYAMNDDSQYLAIEDADKFLEKIIDYKTTFDVKLVVDAQFCNSNPELKISINGQTFYQQMLSIGENVIELSVARQPLGNSSTIEFAMTNKASNDTKVDELGNILEDKAIVLKELYIDDCDLKHDYEFYNNHFYLKSNKSAPTPGLWSNDPLCLDFKLPFVHWYSNVSTKNLTSFMAEMFEKQFGVSNSHSISALQSALEKEIRTLTI